VQDVQTPSVQRIKEIVRALYEKRSVVGRSGRVHELRGEIGPKEGGFLFDVIQLDPAIRRTLEVGCACGMSSLHICAGILDRQGASHTIIDPYQYSQWDGAGVRNLETAGLDFFDLIEEESELALPRLLADNEGQFDFVFVDGWHTFDHTLLDCFYATRLLRVGGVLAIDDVNFASVRRVVDFLEKYPCYEELGAVRRLAPKSLKKLAARVLMSPLKRSFWANVLARPVYRGVFDTHVAEMVALIKLGDDSRNWNWHAEAF
jgi:predicted O-methyltransferase YrrM